jgi:hypothetical protein
MKGISMARSKVPMSDKCATKFAQAAYCRELAAAVDHPEARAMLEQYAADLESGALETERAAEWLRHTTETRPPLMGTTGTTHGRRRH